MSERVLFRSQRNEVFAAVRDADLDPRAFEWEDDYDDPISALIHRLSHYSFSFGREQASHKWNCFYTPAEGGGPTLPGRQRVDSWHDVMVVFKKWVEALHREVSQPDLWEELEREVDVFPLQIAASEEENTAFTTDEQQQIATALGELQEYIGKTADMTQEQLAIVESRVHYLEEASTRVGRKDWAVLLGGALTSVALNAALPPDKVQEMFRFAAQVLGWLLGGAPPALP